MKKFILLGGLLLGRALFAHDIIVFGKNDFLLLDSEKPGATPVDATKATFLAAVKTDLAHPAPFAAPFKLSAPPEWGKTIAGAVGQIEFHGKFSGGFFVRVTLEGLAADHHYILTLNGNPKLAGNERLADPVPGLPAERYFDFLTATTDAHGHYEATFAIALLPGPYDVRFYVKDTTDFKIVLYHDYFKFAVE